MTQAPLPGFSIVTPSYNQARFIRRNIDSVLAQDYPRVEHIVVDNASLDGTVEILQGHPTVTWVSEHDSGQSEAVNKGVSMSRNEWIIWINSDDFLLPGALHALAEYIGSHPDVAMIYSNNVRVDENDAVLLRRAPNYTPWRLRHWWWGSLQLWQPGTVFRRSLFDAAGPLNEQLHYAMDFDFMLRAQDLSTFCYLDADLVAFRLHGDQKGHRNEIPFIDERISSTRAYWRRRNRIAHAAYAALLYFVRGSLMFVEGLRHLERGDRDRGRAFVFAGLRRNPLAVLRPEHLGYWVRRIIGRERYYRWR